MENEGRVVSRPSASVVSGYTPVCERRAIHRLRLALGLKVQLGIDVRWICIITCTGGYCYSDEEDVCE